MKLIKESCYNPFFTDIGNKRYEIGNILFFDRSGVICATGRGWFASETGGSNNDLKNGFELPTTCAVKRKADFSLDSAFVLRQSNNDEHIFGIRYELYIPAAVVGLKAPTIRRPDWDKRHFELTYKSDIPGVCVVNWRFVDAPLHPIQEKITKLGESLSRMYNTTPEALETLIKQLSALKKQYAREYAKMLAITPDEILQQLRRAE